MAHDLVDSLLAKAKVYEKAAKRIRDLVEDIKRLDQKGTIGGMPVFRADGWTVADDLERIMEKGQKNFPRSELERILVEQKVAGEPGSPDNVRLVRLRAARTAITSGKKKGHLAEFEDLSGDTGKNVIRWIPHVYLNPRVQKSS